MSIDINEVSFKINENRWLEIWVGEQEVVSVDTFDGGVLLCRDADEIGNIVETEDGGFEFKTDDEGQEPEKESETTQDGGFRVVYTPPVLKRILATLERIEQKL